jgi:hypothetical protein
MKWIELARGRFQWRVFVNMEMRFQFSLKNLNKCKHFSYVKRDQMPASFSASMQIFVSRPAEKMGT